MKHIAYTLLLFVLLSNISFAQIQSQTLSPQAYKPYTFGIARSIAMGGTGAAESHSGIYQFINPALLSDLKGIELGGGQSLGYYQDKNHPTYVGYFGAKILKKTFLGASIEADNIRYTLSTDQVVRNTRREYSFSIGQNILETEKNRLDVGLRFNTHPQKIPGIVKGKGSNLDLGLRFQSSIAEHHKISAGLVLGNLLQGKDKWIYYETQVLTIPYSSQLTIGLSYQYETARKISKKQLTLLTGIANAEYNDQLSLKYYSTIRSGVELKFLELISLRAGYYSLRAGYYRSALHNFYVNEEEGLKECLFTMGFGVELPFDKIFIKPWPFVIGADYCRAKYPNYDPPLINFAAVKPASSFNFKLVWKMS